MAGPKAGGNGPRRAAALAAALIALAAGNAPAEDERFEFRRVRMGVPFTLVVYAPTEAAASTASDAAFRRIKDLDAALSDYNPNSELNRLVRDAKPGEPAAVSEDLFAVLERSRRYSDLSGGAFDVTVGPAVKLWRRARRAKAPPDPAELDTARSLIGYRQVTLDQATRSVTLSRTGLGIDLGGIATGYACDEAVEVLKAHGLTRAMVDGSGDILCGDPPPGKDGWTVEIDAGGSLSGQEKRTIRLANAAVTTSGDAFNFVEFDGVRYSHILDPATGLGLTTRSAATVVAPDCTAADALATICCVLGPEKAVPLIEKVDGTDLLMIVATDDGTRTVTTPGFGKHLVE